MRHLLLVCCVGLLGAAPAAASDYVNGDWFILTGKNKIWSSNPDHPAVKDLAKFAKDNWEVRFVVLPTDSSYVFHFAGGLWGINPPDSLWKKEDELGKAKREVKCIGLMAQGGWALLDDKCELAQDGIPAAIRARLQAATNDVKKAGGVPRSLAFAPDGGWVLLFDKDFKQQGLPKDLSQTLAEHKQNCSAVRCVAFNSRGDWFLLDEGNDCLSNSPDHPAYKKLQELRAQGEVLQQITFTPGEYLQGYILEHQPVQRIKAVLTTKFDCPGGGVDRWVVFPPQVPELPRQRDVKVTLEPASVTVPDTGPLSQTVLLSRVTEKPTGFLATATYEMTLYTNRLIPRLAGQKAPKAHLPPELTAAYTRVSDDIKAKVFQDFLDKAELRRGPNETDMAFARRAFYYIAKHFKYGPNKDGVDTVQSRVGDCGGLTWVFVRALRANGVPARSLVGRWAGSEVPAKDGQDYYGQWHVKPEYFADGLGWVGLDMSGGVSVEGNPFVCFGSEGGDFVTLDLDVDRLVELWPGDRPSNLGGSQGMFFWYFGNASKVSTSEEHWTVDVLDRHPAATPFRARWKRPPPSGPDVVHKKPAPASQKEPSAPPKTTADEPTGRGPSPPEVPTDAAPAEGEGKAPDTEWASPWLLVTPVISVVLLLGLLVLKCLGSRRAVGPPATVKLRCVQCGKVVKVLDGAAGKKFQCPGCGTVQRIGT